MTVAGKLHIRYVPGTLSKPDTKPTVGARLLREPDHVDGDGLAGGIGGGGSVGWGSAGPGVELAKPPPVTVRRNGYSQRPNRIRYGTNCTRSYPSNYYLPAERRTTSSYYQQHAQCCRHY